MNPTTTPPDSLPVTPPTEADFNLVDALRDQQYEDVYSLDYGAAGRAVRKHVAAEVASATAELREACRIGKQAIDVGSQGIDFLQAEIARLSVENTELRAARAQKASAE